MGKKSVSALWNSVWAERTDVPAPPSPDPRTRARAGLRDHACRCHRPSDPDGASYRPGPPVRRPPATAGRRLCPAEKSPLTPDGSCSACVVRDPGLSRRCHPRDGLQPESRLQSGAGGRALGPNRRGCPRPAGCGPGGPGGGGAAPGAGPAPVSSAPWRPSPWRYAGGPGNVTFPARELGSHSAACR